MSGTAWHRRMRDSFHRLTSRTNAKAQASGPLSTAPSASGSTVQLPVPAQGVPDENGLLWQKAEAKVREKYSRKDWLKITHDFRGQKDYVVFVKAIQNLQAASKAREDEQWTLGGSRPVTIRSKVDKIIGYANNFRDAGASIAQADPTQHAGLAWGLVGIFVAAAARNNETHEAIQEYESIARIMCRAAVLARFYLGNAVLGKETSKGFSDELTYLYEKILAWLIETAKFVQQGQIRHSVRALLNDVTIKADMAAIEKQEDKVFRASRLAEIELNHSVPDTLETVMETVANLKARVTEDERQRLLGWISNDDYLGHQEAVYGQALQGTGSWLIEHPKLENWLRLETSSVLWLNGKLGSGKSTAVSLLVHHLKEERTSHGLQDTIATVYCHEMLASTKYKTIREAIYFAILRQLLSDPRQKFPLSLAQDYESKRGVGIFTVYAALMVLKNIFMQSNSDIIIVLDGLEAVPLEARTKILDELKSFSADQPQKLKILVSSHRAQDIADLVKEFPAKTEVPVENDKDLDLYIEHQVAEEFRLNRLNSSLANIKTDIENGLKARHGGMFLWVKFSLQDLRRRGSSESVLNRLRQLPRKLETLYKDLYKALKQELDPPDLKMVCQAFMFTLYGNPWACITTEAVLESIYGRKRNKQDRAQLVDFCSGFLSSDLAKSPQSLADDRCRFSHKSIEVFFRTHADFAPAECHFVLGRLCLERYLSFFAPDCYDEWVPGDLFSYASTQWVQHYVEPLLLRRYDPEADVSAAITELHKRLSQDLHELNPNLGTTWHLRAALGDTRILLRESLPQPGDSTTMLNSKLKVFLEAIACMTSSPPNALFAAALWADTNILERAEDLADPALWSQRNPLPAESGGVRGSTPVELARQQARLQWIFAYAGDDRRDHDRFVRRMEALERAAQRRRVSHSMESGRRLSGHW